MLDMNISQGEIFATTGVTLSLILIIRLQYKHSQLKTQDIHSVGHQKKG